MKYFLFLGSAVEFLISLYSFISVYAHFPKGFFGNPPSTIAQVEAAKIQILLFFVLLVLSFLYFKYIKVLTELFYVSKAILYFSFIYKILVFVFSPSSLNAISSSLSDISEIFVVIFGLILLMIPIGYSCLSLWLIFTNYKTQKTAKAMKPW